MYLLPICRVISSLYMGYIWNIFDESCHIQFKVENRCIQSLANLKASCLRCALIKIHHAQKFQCLSTFILTISSLKKLLILLVENVLPTPHSSLLRRTDFFINEVSTS